MLSYERRHLGLLGHHKRPSGGENLVGLVRSIEVNIASVGNIGAGLDPLHSFELPINSLRKNGDYIKGWYGGDYAANANPKRIVSSIEGTVWEDTGLQIFNTNGWKIIFAVIRLSSTSILVSGGMVANSVLINNLNVVNSFGEGFFSTARNRVISPVPDLSSNPLSLLVEGEGTAADDVIQNISIFELAQN